MGGSQRLYLKTISCGRRFSSGLLVAGVSSSSCSITLQYLLTEFIGKSLQKFLERPKKLLICAGFVMKHPVAGFTKGCGYSVASLRIVNRQLTTEQEELEVKVSHHLFVSVRSGVKPSQHLVNIFLSYNFEDNRRRQIQAFGEPQRGLYVESLYDR